MPQAKAETVLASRTTTWQAGRKGRAKRQGEKAGTRQGISSQFNLMLEALLFCYMTYRRQRGLFLLPSSTAAVGVNLEVAKSLLLLPLINRLLLSSLAYHTAFISAGRCIHIAFVGSKQFHKFLKFGVFSLARCPTRIFYKMPPSADPYGASGV